MLTKAYGESAMSKVRIYEWYKRFQDGHENVEDDERPGRPSTSTTDENVKKVKEMVMNDRRITIRKVADDVGISVGSCHEIFSDVLGDETWVYGYDVETKAQSSQWRHSGSPRPKKTRQVRSNSKIKLTVFFDFNGIVHHEFLPQGQTMNKEYCLQVQRRLR
ncbi:unnamed protein product [Arctia plantaginis]|uniref:Transposase n=1 Tax=Arctia plantaginis TaxID=874455 RepID=A0A8S1AXG7_ARCPL|nr:unnamed protein product [Arctia plantaginis]